MEIQLNKEYNYYDDGKIKEGRRFVVIIKEIIPFNKIDNETLSLWEEEVVDCPWLYSKETDYFIKGKSKDDGEDITFVRTIEDDWFSIGYWGGQLDINGDLYKLQQKIKI